MHLTCILQITKSACSLLFTISTCYWMALVKFGYYLPVLSELLTGERKSRFATDSFLLFVNSCVDELQSCLSIGSFRL